MTPANGKRETADKPCKCGQPGIVGMGEDAEMFCLECFKAELARAHDRVRELCQIVASRERKGNEKRIL